MGRLRPVSAWLAPSPAASGLGGAVSLTRGSREAKGAEEEADRAARAAALRTETINRFLSDARVKDGPTGGSTPLTEPVLLLEATRRHRPSAQRSRAKGWVYAISNRRGERIGTALPISPPSGYRAGHQFRDAAGEPLLSVLAGRRYGKEADVLLWPGGAELAHLEKSRQKVPGAFGEFSGWWLLRQWRRRGFAPRWVMAGAEQIAQITYPVDHKHPQARVILDRSDDPVARVTMTRGGFDAQGATYFWVAEIGERADARLRALALAVGPLWEWYGTEVDFPDSA
jgi:hypothetical protein